MSGSSLAAKSSLDYFSWLLCPYSLEVLLIPPRVSSHCVGALLETEQVFSGILSLKRMIDSFHATNRVKEGQIFGWFSSTAVVYITFSLLATPWCKLLWIYLCNRSTAAVWPAGSTEKESSCTYPDLRGSVLSQVHENHWAGVQAEWECTWSLTMADIILYICVYIFSNAFPFLIFHLEYKIVTTTDHVWILFTE